MGGGVRSDRTDAIRLEDVRGELQGTGGRMEKHGGGSVEEASKTTINLNDKVYLYRSMFNVQTVIKALLMVRTVSLAYSW